MLIIAVEQWDIVIHITCRLFFTLMCCFMAKGKPGIFFSNFSLCIRYLGVKAQY